MSTWRDMPARISEDKIQNTYNTDVVVVGLGYSGTAATRAAAEAGVAVVAVDPVIRERYFTPARDIGHINSQFLKSRGVPEVDPIDLFNEMMHRAGNRANASLVMQFARNCGTAFDWFTDMYGVEGLKDVRMAFMPAGGTKFKSSVDQCLNGFHSWYGTAQFPDPDGWPGNPSLAELCLANMAVAEEHGAKLFFQTRAVQPILEDGVVKGVICQKRDGGFERILARRGVILCAGDFSGNKEMMEDLVTDIGDMMSPGQKFPRFGGQKGQGIQIGVWAGGRLEPRPLPVMGGNYFMMPGISTFGVLWLNRDGKRFCNESFGGPDTAGFAGTHMPRGTYYNVFDENILEDLQWAMPAHCSYDENFPGAVESLQDVMANANKYPCGHPDSMTPMKRVFTIGGNIADNIFSGATPEELAKNAGLSGKLAENVAASIHRYNELAEKKRDEDFGKDSKLLRPMKGRLYLQTSNYDGDMGFMLATVGGLVTDEKQQVLDMNYEPIPGLYASGNCCGRRFGTQYTTPISGVSIGFAITLGREAGKNAALADTIF